MRPTRLLAALAVTGALAAGTVAVQSAGDHADRPAYAMGAAGAPQHVLVIAHRGDSAVAPENTVPAMRAAAAAGADMVEFDVQRTKDGQLIVVHDPTFARTTDVARVFPGRQDQPVGTFTLREVQRLDAGSWKGPRYAGTRIPTLRQVLDAVRPTHLRVLAELKNPASFPGMEPQVAQELVRSGLVAQHRVWVHSFDESALRRFHADAPTVPLGLLTTTAPRAAASPSWLSSLNATVGSVTDTSTDSADQHRMLVFAWPATPEQSRPSQLERVLDDGVAGIITGDPRALRALLQHAT